MYAVGEERVNQLTQNEKQADNGFKMQRPNVYPATPTAYTIEKPLGRQRQYGLCPSGVLMMQDTKVVWEATALRHWPCAK